jgi:hypothetical protein
MTSHPPITADSIRSTVRLAQRVGCTRAEALDWALALGAGYAHRQVSDDDTRRIFDQEWPAEPEGGYNL